jgi:hypothetical protein
MKKNFEKIQEENEYMKKQVYEMENLIQNLR